MTQRKSWRSGLLQIGQICRIDHPLGLLRSFRSEARPLQYQNNSRYLMSTCVNGVCYNDMGHQPEAKNHAACILNCRSDQVFFTNHVAMRYNRLDSTINPWTPPHTAQVGRAITILALGNLKSDNGLPGFGNPPQYCILKSGQALHALANAQQYFKGHSIGWALVLSWTRQADAAQLSPNTES